MYEADDTGVTATPDGARTVARSADDGSAVAVVSAQALSRATAARAPAAQRWYVAIMMCLVYTLSICDRYSISTVLELIRRQLHLSDANVAFLTGGSLAIFYVLFGFPLSWLIDRKSRRDIIVGSLVGWSGLTVATGLARNYTQLLLARIGVGVGEAGGTPGANSLLSDYFAPEQRSMALQVFSLGAALGTWLGSSLAGIIAYYYSWRGMFLALGAPGILVGLLIWLTIREPRRGRLDRHDSAASVPPLRAIMRFMSSQRATVHLILGTGVTALWGWGLLWWTPAFLMRAYGLNVEQAGTMLGRVYLIGGGLSMVGSTWLLSRPWLTDQRRILRVTGAAIAFGTVVTWFIYSTHSLALFKILLWLFIPTVYMYLGPSFGILNNLAPANMRAMYCAVLLLVANVLNLMVAPQVVGFLSDSFAPRGVPDAASLRLALLCLVPTGFWAAWHFVMAGRYLRRDLQRLAQARDLPAVSGGGAERPGG
jgi:MFS family permease